MKKKLLLYFAVLTASFGVSSTLYGAESYPIPFEEDFAQSLGEWSVVSGEGSQADWTYNATGKAYLSPGLRGSIVDTWLISPSLKLEKGETYELYYEVQTYGVKDAVNLQVTKGTSQTDILTHELLHDTVGLATFFEPLVLKLTLVAETAGSYNIGFRMYTDGRLTKSAFSVNSVKVVKLTKPYVVGKVTITSDISMSYGLSTTGQYIVGTIRPESGGGFYIWDMDNSTYTKNSVEPDTEGRAISNNQIVAGRFMDKKYTYGASRTPIQNGGYFKDGVWHSLGMREDRIAAGLSSGSGSSVDFINGEGTIIGGGMQGAQNLLFVPTLWHLQSDGSYEPTFLETCNTGFGDRILSASEDGSVVSGVGFPFQAKSPVVWVNGKYKPILYKGMRLDGDAAGVSPNGKYVALAVNLRAALYDVENDSLTFIGTDGVESYLTAVSDNGVAVGYEKSKIGASVVYRAIVYTEKLGKQNIPGVDQASGISANGRVVSAGMQNGPGLAYVLDDYSNLRYRPGSVGISENGPNSVVINWKTPKSEDHVVSGYNVYRNGAKVNSELITGLAYTDKNVTPGRYTYTLKAVYADGEESYATDAIRIDVNGLRTLPFYEDFTKYKDAANRYPLADAWSSEANLSKGWIVSTGAGIEAPCLAYFGPNSEHYDFDIKTAYLDATNVSDVMLSFNLALSSLPYDKDSLHVEVYDGQKWNKTVGFTSVNGSSQFTPIVVNISEWAANKVTRVRFVASGSSKPYSGPGTMNTAVWYVDNVRIFDLADAYSTEQPIDGAVVRHEDGSVRMHWAQPNKTVNLSYLEIEDASSKSLGDPNGFIATNLYPKEDISAYKDYVLTSISAYLTQKDGTPKASLKLVVYQDGVLVYEQPIVSYIKSEWNEFMLKTPLKVDVSKSLQYGIEIVSQASSDLPIALGEDTRRDYIFEGRSNVVSEDGGKTWTTVSEILQDANYDRNLMIKATLEKEGATPVDPRIYGYKVYRNGVASDLVTIRNQYDDSTKPEEEVTYKITTYYIDQSESAPLELVLSVSSINEVGGDNQFLIFPNPAVESINIEGDFVKATIRTISGVEVVATSESKINVQNLPQGVYLITIQTRTNDTVVRKFIKK